MSEIMLSVPDEALSAITPRALSRRTLRARYHFFGPRSSAYIHLGYVTLTRYNRPKSSDFLALNSSWDRMPLRSNSANRSIFANISVS